MLNDTQIQQFQEDGFIFVPDLFTPEEVDILKLEIPGIFSEERPEVVREKTGGAVRTAFATHTYNDVYRRFVSHPRILEPAQQMLGGSVYVHQFKLNGKAALMAKFGNGTKTTAYGTEMMKCPSHAQ